MAEGAYIDLKNCDFFLEDGYSNAGAVNNVAGYAVGASVITVDTFATAIANGLPLKFAGHDTEYTVVSTVGGSTPTSITITPVLTDAVVDDEVITVGPNRLEVIIGDGNLTFDEKKPREYKKNRGLLDQVRDGDEEPMDVSFQFAWLYLKSASAATVPTVKEFFKRTGPAAAYVTTGKDCEPYAVDIILKNKVPTCGAVSEPWEKIRLKTFR
jgi:hypothetical protein